MKTIGRVELGNMKADFTHSYNINHSTTGTILKNKDKIMEHVKSTVPMMPVILILLKKLGKVMEELEKLLSVLVLDQHQDQDLLSLLVI